MKRLFLLVGLLGLLGATAFAQSQRTSRTKSRDHDRSETISGDTVKNAIKAPTDKADHEPDMDRNNPPQNSKENSGAKQETNKDTKK